MGKYLYLVLLCLSCCGNARKEVKPQPVNILVRFTSITGISEDTVCGVLVTLVQDFMDSSNTAGTILVLPGWDFERHRWLNETKLKEEAIKHRYRLILPEMKRSIYATHFYKETSQQALKEKTGKWLTDTFIPAIQQRFGVLMPGKRNFAMGLSTGGRGAVYCLWKLPGVFKAAASFSGDFDPVKTPEDFLVTEVYGKYEMNKERWAKEDNLLYVADSIRSPIYLAHGDKDNVVPFNQTTAFFSKIKRTNGKVKMNLVTAAGHDFKFWGSEVAPALDFFDKVK